MSSAKKLGSLFFSLLMITSIFVGFISIASADVGNTGNTATVQTIDGSQELVVSLDQDVSDVTVSDFTFNDDDATSGVTDVTHTNGEDTIIVSVNNSIDITSDTLDVGNNGDNTPIQELAILEAEGQIDNSSDTPFDTVGTNFTVSVNGSDIGDNATVTAEHANNGATEVLSANTSGQLVQGDQTDFFDAVIDDPQTSVDESAVTVTVNGVTIGDLGYQTNDYIVELDQDEVLINSTETLNGQIFRAPGDLADNTDFDYELVFEDSNAADPGNQTGLYSSDTSDGEFIVRETFNIVDDNLGSDYPNSSSTLPSYKVLINRSSGGAPDLANNTGSDSVDVRTDLSVGFNPSDLSYRDSTDITGSVLDGAGDPITDYEVRFLDPGGTTSKQGQSQTDGSFGFTAALQDAGEYQFGTNEGGFIGYTNLTVDARDVSPEIDIFQDETNTPNFEHNYSVIVRDESANLNIDTGNATGDSNTVAADGYINVTGSFDDSAGVSALGPNSVNEFDPDGDSIIEYFYINTTETGTANFTATPIDGSIEIALENADADGDSAPEGGLEVEAGENGDLATTPAFPDYTGTDSLQLAATSPVNIFDFEILDPQFESPSDTDILTDNGPATVEVLPVQGTDGSDARIENDFRIGKDTFSNTEGLTNYTVSFQLLNATADPITSGDFASDESIEIVGAGVNATVVANGSTSDDGTGVTDVREPSNGEYRIDIVPTEVTDPDEELIVTITKNGLSPTRSTDADGLQITQFDPQGAVVPNADVDVNATVQTPDDEFVNNGRIRVAQDRFNSSSGSIEPSALGDLDARQSSVNINNGEYRFDNLPVGPRGIDTDTDGIGENISQLTFTAYQYADTDDDGVSNLENNEVTRATVETLDLQLDESLNVTYVPANTSEYSGFDDGTFTLTRGVEYDQIAFELTDGGEPVDLTQGIEDRTVNLNTLVSDDLISIEGTSDLTFDTSASNPSEGFYVIEDISGSNVAEDSGTFVFDTTGIDDAPETFNLNIETANRSRTTASGEGVFQAANAEVNTTVAGVAGPNVPNSTENEFTNLDHDQLDNFNTNTSGLETPTIGVNRTYRLNGTATDALGTPLNGSDFGEVRVSFAGAQGGTAQFEGVSGFPGATDNGSNVLVNEGGEFQVDFNPQDGSGDGFLEPRYEVEAQADTSAAPQGLSDITSGEAQNPRVNVFGSNGVELPQNEDGDLILANDVNNQLRLEAFPADLNDFPLPDDTQFHLTGSFGASTIEPKTQLNSTLDTDLVTDIDGDGQADFSSGQLAFFQVAPTASGNEVIQLRDGETRSGAPVATNVTGEPVEFDVLRSNLQVDIDVQSETPLSASDNLTVELTQTSTGEPLRNAQAALIDPEGTQVATALTDANGEATLNVPGTGSGTFTVETRPAGFAPASTNVEVAGAADLTLVDNSLSAPSSAAQNTTITVSAVVENTGGVESTQTVEFRLDQNQDGVLADDEVLASQELNVSAGATQTVDFDIPVGTLATGTYEHGIFTPVDDQTATINITASGAPAPVEDPATNVDGDQQLEDVNGDSELGILDVVALFDNLNSNTVQDNTELFDFNGDGQVDILDVVALNDERSSA